MRQGWRTLSQRTAAPRRGRTVRPLAAVAALLLLQAGPAVTTQLPIASAGASTAAYAPSPVTYGGWAAGYMAYAPAGHAFTAISTRFRLPSSGPLPLSAGAAATSDGWVSLWAGIGVEAQNGGNLMQAGVSMHAGPGGWDVSAPWWINEPRQPTEPHALPLPVNPGDLIQVDIVTTNASRTDWDFTVTDVATGGHQTGVCDGCAADTSTAAWVEEDPLSGTVPAQFADPGAVQFVSASVALDGGTLTPLGASSDWRPLIRTLRGLVQFQPAPGQLPLTKGPSSQGAAQGPLAAGPGTNGAFTVGELLTA